MPRILAKIKEGQTVCRMETVWTSKDGRLVDVSLQVSPILDDSGRIVGASSIAEAGEAAGRKPVAAAVRPAQGETLLLLEDDAGLREFICLALGKLVYRALSAEGPAGDKHKRP